MNLSYLLLCSYLIISCQSQKVKIFSAEKNEANKLVQIDIFKDYQYIMSVDDSILEEGKAQLKGQKLILTPEPDNALNTLTHNKEFEIIESKLCSIKYEQQNKDTSRSKLIAPVQVADKTNCFEIKMSFK